MQNNYLPILQELEQFEAMFKNLLELLIINFLNMYRALIKGNSF